jgi:WD40 repeat protein
MDAPATPFKGLVPFEASDLDALLFFGRERERDLIVANLLASRLTVLYGPVGVGKTSLLRAGVAHRLRQEIGPDGRPEYGVVVFGGWSEDPWASLRVAMDAELGDAGDKELFLLIDQLEEYFLYHGHEDGPGTFAGELPELVTGRDRRISVLLAIREDALARLDRFKGHIPGLFSNYLSLDHLDREAARAAILGPVDRYNRLADAAVKVEDALVEAVLDQTAVGRLDFGAAGAGRVAGNHQRQRIEAPYLQLVLRRLWDAERAEGSETLRLTTFEELGGAEAIVRAHLERALADLDQRERDLAASVFRHLVTPSGSKIAHAIDDLAEYAEVDARELRPVVTKLVEERILRPVAPEGDGGNGVPHEIYHDVLGDAVLAWRTRHETERRLETARRRHRRALALVGVAVAGLVVMTAVAVYALAQRGQARSAERQARAAERAAQARALDATALSAIQTDPAHSLNLALRASELSEAGQSVRVLRSSLLYSRVRAVLRGGDAGAAFSPDARWIYTAEHDGRDRIYETPTRRLVSTFRHPHPLLGAAFSPDSRRLLTFGRREVILWRVPAGNRVWRVPAKSPVTTAVFAGPSAIAVGDARGGITVLDLDGRSRRVIDGAAERGVRTLAATRDGRLVAVGGDHQAIRVFDVASGARLWEFEQGGFVKHLAFSRSGRLLASAGANKTARIWDMRLGKRYFKEIRGHDGEVLDAEFSPRGLLLVTASTDGTARVSHIATATPAAPLIGHTNGVRTAVFDSFGDFVVTASTDKTARVWKADNGLEVTALVGHRDAVISATFEPGATGLTVLTASADGTSRLWDAQIQPPVRLVARRLGPVAKIARGGRWVAVAGRGVRLFDAPSLRIIRTLRTGPVRAVALSRDGKLLAAVTRAGTTVYRTESGRRVTPSFRLRPAELSFGRGGTLYAGDARGLYVLRAGTPPRRISRDPVSALALSNDGRRLATGGVNGGVTLRRLDGSIISRLAGKHRDVVNSVMFNPSDTLLVTASLDHFVHIWSLRARRSIAVSRIHFGNVAQASFSPDGRWIVTAGPATAGLLRVPDGEELLLLRGHAKPLTGAVFVTDRRVVTASRDGTVGTYVCELCGRLPALQQLARTRLREARLR